ncbi:MAG: hypothetical protein EXR76_16070, partial [Myxococcales bacterium]|nr:hypothetical protein [Myxococcales bacterium]
MKDFVEVRPLRWSATSLLAAGLVLAACGDGGGSAGGQPTVDMGQPGDAGGGGGVPGGAGGAGGVPGGAGGAGGVPGGAGGAGGVPG